MKETTWQHHTIYIKRSDISKGKLYSECGKDNDIWLT